MSSNITLSSKTIVKNGYNNQLHYNVRGSVVNFKNAQIAVESINIYNSQFNIDSDTYENNTFKLLMPTARTFSTVQITLSSGYYSYANINSAVQAACISAGAYLIDSNGNNVYFFNLSETPTFYSAQIDLLPVPTALGTYTRPPSCLYSSAGSGLPTSFPYTPKLVIDNEEFGSIIGFPLGQWPTSSVYTKQSFLSPISPQINPTACYQVRCNLVKNPYSIPDDILTTFNTAGTTIGQLISYRPNEFNWVSIPDGSFNSVRITIVDQDERFVKFNDSNMLIGLSIRQNPNKKMNYFIVSVI
ncbi:hypothetical protein PHYSODRAFT_512049 [Phytophthora sojae]|uniref:Uncharacterized protein n=1 Tax=Phytophthora sojae (strain P6497) TaxID=1094619 RepID=G4ZS60_PHYSP|nr:hypothetical protein PHYSODRAFT_512049 [Phytophthora sojae]EGZ14356.1 hypothetical protein PHYSODRAFT_512049 [Phytophthora sojae]|eukprot:XP_009531785.1 hypothetical protein PHYSODRAFT_512049 [Phytophthora sojae]